MTFPFIFRFVPAAMLLGAAVPSSRGEQYDWRGFAGNTGGEGISDGTGAAAHFNSPYGIARDAAGNLYVADSVNHTVRKITPAGAVTTFAGNPAVSGNADGTGTAATFQQPRGIAVASDGTVYVSDATSHLIRKITPAGVVTTLAGSAGASGSANGTGSAARFNGVWGLTVDPSGNIYATDYYSHTIRRITPAGVVTTPAGSPFNNGYTDGTGSAARFTFPQGIASDPSGNLYISHGTNIRRMTPAGVVTTVAGAPSQQGYVDGTGAAAQFGSPAGLVVESSGNLLVADSSNSYAIRRVTPAGVVTTVAGNGNPGSVNGTGTAARFSFPTGVTVDAAGNAYVADYANHAIRKISPARVVTTLAGGPRTSGSANGAGSAAGFYYPYGLDVDGAGNAYVADNDNGTIRKVTPAGVVTTLAGTAGLSGSTDATGAAARFGNPKSVAVDASGNVFVADYNNHSIRKITPGGVVTTFAGVSGMNGSDNGTGSGARFYRPSGIAIASDGTLYVSEPERHTIRRITSAAVVTTFAGTVDTAGSTDATGAAARFTRPDGLAVDGAGNVYVADNYNHTIRKITPGGVVTTLAGLATIQGSADGTGTAARFRFPVSVAADAAGTVFVADTSNSTIRRITPAGVVTTIGGIAGVRAISDGIGGAARFYFPSGIAMGPGGVLYLSDTENHRLVLGTPIPPVALTQNIVTAEDTSAAILLTGTDIDGDPLTFAIVTPPAHGTLTGAGAARTYTPAADYNGPDSFTFKANDGTLDSAPATVSITVTAVNDQPVATAQTVTGPEDTPVAVILAGTDIDGDSLTFAIVTPPSRGTVTGTATNITFTPAANFNGEDSFTFKTKDGTLDSVPAAVSITITAVNDQPVAAAQEVMAVEDTPLAIILAGTDIDGDALTFAIMTPPAHGTLTGSFPNITYSPAADYNGPDFFTFKANDGALDSAPAMISIDITAVNDAPVFTAPLPDIDAGPAAPDAQFNLLPLLRDPDAGDSHTWRIAAVGNPSIFAAVNVDAGLLSLSYAPYVSGDSSLTIEVMDAAGEIAQMTIQVTLPPLPAPEIAVSEALRLNRQTGLWEHRLTFRNTAQRPIGGFEVTVSGLPAGTCLYNASDCLGANPVAGYYQPMAPGESLTMVLEYFSPSRSTTLQPVITTAVALPRIPVPGAAAGLAVDRVTALPDGALLIEFTALPGHEYLVQYTPDGSGWLDSPLRIRAAGNRVQWIDRGIPRTASPPPPGGQRFYRVREAAPAP